ncbi:MAG: hypothetical protein N4A70_05500 [Pelagimonas sp.]|jgi:excinuclease UvrABC ATPase subunit|nr:hypothetical protein [Pelagimonas sp.]
MAVVICHACDGEGVQRRRDPFEGMQEIRCPICNGQRVLNKVVTVRYEQVKPVTAPDSYPK